MRKLTKILLVCLLVLVYYYACISYFWYSECLKRDIEKLHNINHMPKEVRVIYDLCKNSKLEAIAEKPNEDYWKAPYETERDGGGDCEDLSFWLLHKLTNMGYDCWVILGGDESGAWHMWVRIRTKDGVYYDADMVGRYVIRAFFPVPFRLDELEKMQAVIEKQEKYERGE